MRPRGVARGRASRARVWLRWVTCPVILGALLVQLGAEPFVDGLRSVGLGAAAAAVAVTFVTTWCAAWRWRLVAAALGVPLGWRVAVGAYYGSQLLNSALPGGVVGDVDRAVRHGREAGDLGASARAVALERALGLLSHLLLTTIVLVAVPSPFRPLGLLLLVALLVVTAVVLVGWAAGRGRQPGRPVARAVADVRAALAAVRVRCLLAATSSVVAVGHTTVFLVAALAAGAGTSAVLAPLAVLTLLGSAVPLSIAGWGPREGVAAWAFAVAGVGAAAGVTVSVAYGALSLVATLPGAVALALRGPLRRDIGPAPDPARVSVGGGGIDR